MAEESPNPRHLEELTRRLDQLERENERLRQKVEPILGPDNPWFDSALFLRVVRRMIVLCTVPLYVCLPLVGLAVPFMRYLPNTRIGPVPLIDFAGMATGYYGLGMGIIALGGGAVGVLAIGGMSVGVIAVGGGSIGIIAVGGGSIGLIAIGGGAVGYIAIGGAAFGYYALGQSAHGRYALGLNRQDPEAVAFFVPLVPGLRNAVTTPMPVIPLGPKTEQQATDGDRNGRQLP